jgi:large subunit ribosomal protein L17
MRHGKKHNHLGRTTSHRKAMLANMASSLIKHKRISTTLAKAKALRVYVEPIITKSKNDTTHSRRIVFSYLQDKETVTELFRDVAAKVANRPGGYTRIIKLNNRLGDNAEMALIELVDYNEIYGQDAAAAEKKTTRRGRSKTAKTASAPAAEKAPKAEAAVEDAVVVEEEAPATEEVAVEEAPVAEATTATEDATPEAPAAEEATEEEPKA